MHVLNVITALPDLGSIDVWLSLLTLTFLEIVLGIDNIIFISIASNRLPVNEQKSARNIGLILAMVFRIALLFGISYFIAMQAALAHWSWSWGEFTPTGQSIILFLGGIFLLYKSTTEIHDKLEGEEGHHLPKEEKKRGRNRLINAIIQIAVINIVFSIDSILTAVGLTNNLWIMIFAVVLSVIIMMLFAGPVGHFVNKHPSLQILGLAFLILIGFMLVAEAAHLAHVKIGESEVGGVPKGYLYFAIAFSLFVEFLNMRLRKKQTPVALHGIQEDAIKEGVL